MLSSACCWPLRRASRLPASMRFACAAFCSDSGAGTCPRVPVGGVRKAFDRGSLPTGKPHRSCVLRGDLCRRKRLPVSFAKIRHSPGGPSAPRGVAGRDIPVGVNSRWGSGSLMRCSPGLSSSPPQPTAGSLVMLACRKSIAATSDIEIFKRTYEETPSNPGPPVAIDWLETWPQHGTRAFELSAEQTQRAERPGRSTGPGIPRT